MRWTAFRRKRNEEQHKERKKKHFQFLNALTNEHVCLVSSRLSFDSECFFFFWNPNNIAHDFTKFHTQPHTARTTRKILTLHADRTTRAYHSSATLQCVCERSFWITEFGCVWVVFNIIIVFIFITYAYLHSKKQAYGHATDRTNERKKQTIHTQTDWWWACEAHHRT